MAEKIAPDEPKIISDEEITVLTNKLIEARDILHAFDAWPSNQLISSEEITLPC